MTVEKPLKLFEFENKAIRSHWDSDQEIWFISIVDVIAALTGSNRPRKYWSDLKNKLCQEGSELSEKIGRLKMKSIDGKFYLTDVATTEQLLRLIQSIPSPKAEPFKLWLAQVGYQRIEEHDDPEQVIDRAIKLYEVKGYSREWITERLRGKIGRNELTTEWQRSGIQGSGFAVLTDIISKEWSGFTTKQYKQHKDLKKENLRDHMSSLELSLNSLAESATVAISKVKNPIDMNQNQKVAKQGGGVAKNARVEIEGIIGINIISADNYLVSREKNKLGIDKIIHEVLETKDKYNNENL